MGGGGGMWGKEVEGKESEYYCRINVIARFVKHEEKD